jgi:hypothetical protein
MADVTPAPAVERVPAAGRGHGGRGGRGAAAVVTTAQAADHAMLTRLGLSVNAIAAIEGLGLDTL